MMRRIIGLLITLALAILVAPLAAAAQPPGKIPRVGVLRVDSPPQRTLDEFRQGLRELGYVEGQNIVLEVRSAEERLERLPALAAELVRLEVDVIVTHGISGILAARNATSTIPIVMGRMGDADGYGFVASLARPAGNITGLSFQSDALSGQWLDLLKEALPGLSRVAVLWEVTSSLKQLRALESSARSMGVQLQVLKVHGPKDFDSAFTAAKTAQAEGLVILASLVFTIHSQQLAELAALHRVPAIFYHRRFAEGGGLLSYGPKESDPSWGWQRAAVYVDKILKGAQPGELPIERPIKFDLVINLKTAQALGLTIPPTLLFQATEVIR
ncbi:MAG TPA: ABC transporter substrate-binding protein [Candidatus Tectomicrobia bacterium]|nr:ABC transporter substrate-binding protein [Candidatus Tectomicrobia bacterium]